MKRVELNPTFADALGTVLLAIVIGMLLFLPVVWG